MASLVHALLLQALVDDQIVSKKIPSVATGTRLSLNAIESGETNIDTFTHLAQSV